MTSNSNSKFKIDTVALISLLITILLLVAKIAYSQGSFQSEVNSRLQSLDQKIEALDKRTDDRVIYINHELNRIECKLFDGCGNE